MPIWLLLAIAGTFVSVGAIAAMIASGVLAHQAPGHKRLEEAIARPRGGVAHSSAGPATLTDQPSKAVQRLTTFVPKSPSEMNKLRRRLVRAGHHSMSAALVFSFSELLVPMTLGGLPLLLLGWKSGFVYAIGFAIVGFLLPGLALGQMITARGKAISNGLPDVLDLLIVCLEAGSSLDQAVVKANEELALSYPALGEELKMLTIEIRAGKPRLEAFRNLDARTKNDDIRSLVAMLVQTDRFGTSISQALRTFAEVSRTKRRQRAEEQAAKVGVKMVFPLVFCLFPALFVATAGAAVVQIVRVFGQLGH